MATTSEDKKAKTKQENLEDSWLVGRWGKFWLTSFYVLGAIILTYLLYVLWPTHINSTTVANNATAIQSENTTLNYTGNTTTATEPITFLTFHWNILVELKLVFMVMVMGMIGRYIHNIKSFVVFTGNRRLVRSWFYFYLLTPLHGAFLALVFYLLLRAGMLTASTGQQSINEYGVLVISGIVGLFSYQAINKLSQVADTFFNAGNEETDDPLSEVEPEISGVVPDLMKKNNKIQILLSGKGFLKNSTVTIDGTVRESFYLNENTIKVDITDIQVGSKVKIIVANSKLEGGESEEFPWVVTAPDS
jgi:hypothetical protein